MTNGSFRLLVPAIMAAQLFGLTSSQSVVPNTKSLCFNAPLFVTDSHGFPVAGVAPDDIVIRDNKVPPQSVVGVHTAVDLPLRLGLLIDTSKSQSYSPVYRPAVRAAVDSLSHALATDEDRAFVMTFDNEPKATEFMNRDQLSHFVLELHSGGGTAFYDAVVLASKIMNADGDHLARRVLVIVSDGDDNVSRVSEEESIGASQDSGSPVFVIDTGTTDPWDGIDKRGRLDVHRTAEVFAEKTGGAAFSFHALAEIPKAFASIKEQIESMLVVTYTPADYGSTGQHHSVEIKAAPGKAFRVRATQGYSVHAASAN